MSIQDWRKDKSTWEFLLADAQVIPSQDGESWIAFYQCEELGRFRDEKDSDAAAQQAMRAVEMFHTQVKGQGHGIDFER